MAELKDKVELRILELKEIFEKLDAEISSLQGELIKTNEIGKKLNDTILNKRVELTAVNKSIREFEDLF